MKPFVRSISTLLIVSIMFASLAPCKAAGQPVATFEYDASGNLTKETRENGEVIVYGYDGFNRLTTVTTASGTTTYVYGAGNDIVQKILPDGRTHYYFGKLSEKDPDGNWINYIYRDPISTTHLIAIEDKNGTHYVISDHLGSPSLIIDAEGNVEQRIDYLPFGQERVNQIIEPSAFPNTTPPTPFGFTGQRKNNDGSGLINYGSRFYHPALMRFTQPDPVVVDTTRPEFKQAMYNPQLLNPYAYAGNNPIKYVDPTGEQFVKPSALTGIPDSALSPAEQQLDRMAQSLTPVYGDIQDVQEMRTGRDYYTQEPLTDKEKTLARVGMVLPIISGRILREGSNLIGEIGKKLVKVLNDIKINKIIKRVENGATEIRVGSREEAIEAGMRFVGENPRRMFNRQTGAPIGWESVDGIRKFREPAQKFSGGRQGSEGANLEIVMTNNRGGDERIVNTHLVW